MSTHLVLHVISDSNCEVCLAVSEEAAQVMDLANVLACLDSLYSESVGLLKWTVAVGFAKAPTRPPFRRSRDIRFRVALQELPSTQHQSWFQGKHRQLFES